MPRRLRVKFPPPRLLQAVRGLFAVTGNPAILTEGNPQVAPYIITQPVAVSTTAPNAATFTVFAGGTAPLTYQWYRTGVAIPGATSASYTLSPTATSDTGATFYCVVSNGIGTPATSSAVALTVGPSVGWAPYVAPFAQGTPSSQQITAPSGYAASGSYDIANSTLPGGITLSDSGLLAYDGAGAASSAQITFGYNEPGALPILTLWGTGTNVPYMATVYPAEGAVPSGYGLTSTDDTNLRSSTLSSWPDGSAQVMVVAGSKTVSGSTTLRLRPAIVSQTPLTTAAISAAVTSIAVNFGGGVQTLSSFASPDWTWWANSQVICARYRLSCGLGDMEAVIDIHAFAGGRAFVEVVIENGSILPSSTTTPTTQPYTNATVAVNGSTIATVSSSHTYDVAYDHVAFTAWYCSTWVGGDPGIEITHDTASMQAHPLLYKIEKASTVDLATTYGSDAYTPWNGARNRAAQAGTGDHASIGPLPQWEARYLQSGDKNARRAVLASGLALLHSNVQYRNSSTRLPLTPTEVLGKTVASGSFPRAGGYPFADYTANYHWDYAHQPAAGLIPFLCRPSPCFIELAQRVATYNSLGNNAGDGLLGKYFAQRGKAWGWRNAVHATFLTPDSQAAMKTALQAMLTRNVNYFRLWDASAEDKLNYMWDDTPTEFSDVGDPGFQQSQWMFHFFVPEVVKAHHAKVLTGADQTSLGLFADWMALQPVRWINEQPNGGWRYIAYRTVIGTNNGGAGGMGQSDDWGTMRATIKVDAPASVSGAWYTSGSNDSTTYASGWVVENGNSGYQYVGPFWTSLCAAVERGVSGADTAWSTVVANVTNLSTFRNHAATDPRHHCYPRNK